ncbi:MAG TPA: hypothetical protein PLG50_04225 [bacterium]|nr:hypothetical protein [bacterium]HQG44842.1 hypothetical protein [bacterium]HQI48498.1 hypothetical protein [bacterium]HQJ65792.1 hypothetical protein [bacterium]
MGTADDLDFQTIVAELAAVGIQVVSIDSSPRIEDAVKNFTYMATQTNGKYFVASDAIEIPPAIISLIGEIFAIIAWLDLEVYDTATASISSTPIRSQNTGSRANTTYSWASRTAAMRTSCCAGIVTGYSFWSMDPLDTPCWK